MSDLELAPLFLSPISRAAKTAHPVVVPNRAEIEALTDKMQHQDQILTNQRGLLFGIEEDARFKLQEQATELLHDTFHAQRQLELARIADRFPALSLEPFTWRDEQGLPQLVIFSLDDPLFRYEVRYTRQRWWRHDSYIHRAPRYLPTQIDNQYNDVIDLLKQRAVKERHDVTLACRFSGALPLSTRKTILGLIHELKHRMDLFIIAEPERWDLKKEGATQRNPLLAGWYHGQLWLIDTFDVLPVEAALALLRAEIEKGEPVSDH